jgi:hypothetical protein
LRGEEKGGAIGDPGEKGGGEKLRRMREMEESNNTARGRREGQVYSVPNNSIN